MTPLGAGSSHPARRPHLPLCIGKIRRYLRTASPSPNPPGRRRGRRALTAASFMTPARQRSQHPRRIPKSALADDPHQDFSHSSTPGSALLPPQQLPRLPILLEFRSPPPAPRIQLHRPSPANRPDRKHIPRIFGATNAHASERHIQRRKPSSFMPRTAFRPTPLAKPLARDLSHRSPGTFSPSMPKDCAGCCSARQCASISSDSGENFQEGMRAISHPIR